jgi:hypothetical protein
MLKPRNPVVDKLKVVKTKVKDKNENFKPIFDNLLPKYVNWKTVSKNRSSKGITSPSPKQDRSHSHRSGQVSNVIKVGSTDVTIDTQINHKVLDHVVSNQSCSGFEVRRAKMRS